MKYLSTGILLASIGLASCVSSKDAVSESNSTRIITELHASNLHKHARVLSSDAMEGRGSGYAGEERAARYIAEQFAAAGLSTIGASYLHPFEYVAVGGATPFQRLHSRNVIGFLEGASRPEEVVVLGAHFDGQGMSGQADAGRFGEAEVGEDRIWNSASDNAVSIAAMIEIARVLAQSDVPPARSILFVALSGEENRLNGSFEYVQSPPVGWSRHVAMINLEKLVGHEETEMITASKGSSSGFTEIASRAAKESGLDVLSFYDGVVSDTDHFAFIAAGLPALVIGTGAYDNIHQNTDEYETLKMAELPKRSNYVLAFLRALANSDHRLPFEADIAEYSGVVGGKTTLAEQESCGLDRPAFLVTEIATGLPAAESELKPGDIIVAINEREFEFDGDANFLEEVMPLTGEVVVRVACKGVQREIRFAMPVSN